MIDKQREEGGLRSGAEVPPISLAVGAVLCRADGIVAGRIGAPDVDRAVQGKQFIGLIEGNQRLQAGGVLLDAVHAGLHVRIVLRFRLVGPIDVGNLEPALLAKMAFQLLHFAGKDGLELGTAGLVALALRIVQAAAHAVDAQPEIGEVELLDGSAHCPVEGREIDFGARRTGMKQELHANRVHGRWIVRAEAMVGKGLEIQVPHAALVSVGLEMVVLLVQPKPEGGLDVVPLRQGEVPNVQLDGHGGRPALGLQRQARRVIARLGVLRHVDQHPERLVLCSGEIERLVERRQGVGPPIAALRFGRSAFPQSGSRRGGLGRSWRESPPRRRLPGHRPRPSIAASPSWDGQPLAPLQNRWRGTERGRRRHALRHRTLLSDLPRGLAPPDLDVARNARNPLSEVRPRIPVRVGGLGERHKQEHHCSGLERGNQDAIAVQREHDNYSDGCAACWPAADPTPEPRGTLHRRNKTLPFGQCD